MSVRGSTDVGALSSAVSRPGIDPRVWLTLAVVTELGFDEAHGAFADVTFQPSGVTETCLIGSNYAGAEFGDWCGLELNDTVLVAVPDGDAAGGPWVVSRAWNAGDKPYAEMRSATDTEAPTADRILRVKPGQKFKLRTSGGGDGVDVKVEGDGSYVIEIAGAGNVYLGSGATMQPLMDGVVVAQGIDPFTGLTYGALGNASSRVMARKT
jgi:hypothetical protein